MKEKSKSKPRGIRNNNPLNIVQTNDNWQGLRHPQYDKRFCEFVDMAHGYRAAFIILKNYIARKTVRIHGIFYTSWILFLYYIFSECL